MLECGSSGPSSSFVTFESRDSSVLLFPSSVLTLSESLDSGGASGEWGSDGNRGEWDGKHGEEKGLSLH